MSWDNDNDLPSLFYAIRNLRCSCCSFVKDNAQTANDLFIPIIHMTDSCVHSIYNISDELLYSHITDSWDYQYLFVLHSHWTTCAYVMGESSNFGMRARILSWFIRKIIAGFRISFGMRPIYNVVTHWVKFLFGYSQSMVAHDAEILYF